MTLRQKLLVAVTAAALFAVPAMAQSADNGQASFADSVDRDIAAGYYSKQQGEDLKAQYDSASERVQGSMDRAVSALQKDSSLIRSGSQEFKNLADSIIGPDNKAHLGGSPAEVEEQAKAIYNGIQLGIRSSQAIVDDIKPTLQDAFNEMDHIAEQRAALIKSNPDVSADVKFRAQAEAAKIHNAATYSLDKSLSTLTVKIQEDQAKLENNKAAILASLQTYIHDNAAKYGDDPTKWQKSPDKSQSTKTASTTKTATTPQPSQSTSTPSQTKTASSSPASNKGSVPDGSPDAALSANRGNAGQSVPAGTKTAGQNGNRATTSSAAGAGSANKPSTGQQNTVQKPKEPYIPQMPVIGTSSSQGVSGPTSADNSQSSGEKAIGAGDGKSDGMMDGMPLPKTNNSTAQTGDAGGSDSATNGADDAATAAAEDVAGPAPKSTGTRPVKRGTIPDNSPDQAFNAHRNDPNWDPSQENQSPDQASGPAAAQTSTARDSVVPLPPTVQQGPSRDITDVAADAAKSAAAATDTEAGRELDDWADNYLKYKMEQGYFRPGNVNLVEGEPSTHVNSSADEAQLTAIRALAEMSAVEAAAYQSLEVGSALTVAKLAPIYAGYDLDANPGSAMRSLDLQPPSPSKVMVVPSNQIDGITMQVVVPSMQVNVPSPVMMSLDLQPFLCGR